eukprot:jgi/Astpho2/4796/Aster-00341
MGVCCSSPVDDGEKEWAGMGLAEKTVFPSHSSPMGLQVRASTAGWIANLPFCGLSEVVFGPDYMFAALFSPLTEDTAAADFCRRKAFQAFEVCRSKPDSPHSEVLSNTLAALDCGFLADSKTPAKVRAVSGASGALLLLDFQMEQLCVAEIGPCHHAVLGRLYGGMAVQRAEAQVLGRAGGVNQHSSCLGMGRRKVKALADAHQRATGQRKPWLGPTASPIADVSEHRLSSLDEHIILATPAVWEMLSADEVALRLHFHLKAHSQLDLGLPCTGARTDAFSSPLGTAMHTADGDPPARARARRAEVPNSGEHLVLHAMSRLATKLGRDVHGDVGVVVLSLRWPATSWNQALEPPIKSLLQLQTSADPNAAAARLRARQRWNQLKTLYIEFVRARRQLFLKRWHDAVERMLQRGRAAARQVEEQLWLQHKMSVRVTPSLAIHDVKGRTVAPADVGIVLPQI